MVETQVSLNILSVFGSYKDYRFDCDLPLNDKAQTICHAAFVFMGRPTGLLHVLHILRSLLYTCMQEVIIFPAHI
jgi:hypothetical protein